MLASLPLAETALALDDRTMRVRRLVIEPGGIVPWHSHGDRPALILITKGEIDEYASTCAVPIVHKAGEVAVETPATSHWWKNLGDEPVVLCSVRHPARRDRHQHVSDSGARGSDRRRALPSEAADDRSPRPPR